MSLRLGFVFGYTIQIMSVIDCPCRQEICAMICCAVEIIYVHIEVIQTTPLSLALTRSLIEIMLALTFSKRNTYFIDLQIMPLTIYLCILSKSFRFIYLFHVFFQTLIFQLIVIRTPGDYNFIDR